MLPSFRSTLFLVIVSKRWFRVFEDNLCGHESDRSPAIFPRNYLAGHSARALPNVNTQNRPFARIMAEHTLSSQVSLLNKKNSEEKEMKKNIIQSKKSGRSADIPTEVPEPDQIAPGKDMPVLENTAYSGMRGNMILFLADRQDRFCERMNKKIDSLDQRLTILEEQVRS